MEAKKMADTGMRDRLSIVEDLDTPWVLLLRLLPKRLVALVSKLIGFRGAVLIVATILLAADKLPAWPWVVLVVAIVLGRETLKVVVGAVR